MVVVVMKVKSSRGVREGKSEGEELCRPKGADADSVWLSAASKCCLAGAA